MPVSTPVGLRCRSQMIVHPTAESVYAAVSAEMPTISLRTVYQTLNDLAAMGELSLLDVGTGSTRFDPNLDPHHHHERIPQQRLDPSRRLQQRA